MAIEKRPTGEAAAVAQAGREIGQAEKAKREQQISLEQQAQDAARAWEIQKFVLNSQQDFAHEQRMRQAGLDAEARAREWQVEKMELASRLDFEQDERERLRYKEEYRAGRDVLDEKRKDMPPGDYERALFRLDTIYAPKGVKEAVTGLGFDTKTDLLRQLRGEKEDVLRTERTSPPTMLEITASKKEGDIWMQDIKTGVYGTVPTNEVQSYISAGTHKLATPVATDVGRPSITPGRYGAAGMGGFSPYIGTQPRTFPGGGGGEFGGVGATGDIPEPEPRFPFRKVGSIKDLIKRLDSPVGSINDLLRYLGLEKETEGFYF